jgi:hypothetical protein
MDLDARVSKHAHTQSGGARVACIALGISGLPHLPMAVAPIGHVIGAGGQPMGQRDNASVPAWVRP